MRTRREQQQKKEIALNYMDDRKRHRYYPSRKIFAYASNKLSIMWHRAFKSSSNTTTVQRYIIIITIALGSFFAVLGCLDSVEHNDIAECPLVNNLCVVR